VVQNLLIKFGVIFQNYKKENLFIWNKVHGKSVWKTASETHEALESVYRNEAVSHSCVLNCSQDSEGDMRIWKFIQGVCIHQLLNIQKELQRLVIAGQRLLNALKLMKDRLCVRKTQSS
jgi:hypothetical protein